MKRLRFDWVAVNNLHKYLGECEAKDDPVITIYFDRNWRKARRRARVRRTSAFRLFVEELCDTIVHEVVHAYAPEHADWKSEERLASRFAAEARRLAR